jgi:hypothetical protein
VVKKSENYYRGLKRMNKLLGKLKRKLLSKAVLQRSAAFIMSACLFFVSTGVDVFAYEGKNGGDYDAILRELTELCGDEAKAREICDYMRDKGLLGQNFFTKIILVNGSPKTVDEVRALISDAAADLSAPVSIDGYELTLGDLKKMIEIEDEIKRLQDTYFSDVPLTEEQERAIRDIQDQIEHEGINLYGPEGAFDGAGGGTASETGTPETENSETGASEAGASETGTSETGASEAGASETNVPEVPDVPPTGGQEAGLGSVTTVYETEASETEVPDFDYVEPVMTVKEWAGPEPLSSEEYVAQTPTPTPPRQRATPTGIPSGAAAHDLRIVVPKSVTVPVGSTDVLVELRLVNKYSGNYVNAIKPVTFYVEAMDGAVNGTLSIGENVAIVSGTDNKKLKVTIPAGQNSAKFYAVEALGGQISRWNGDAAFSLLYTSPTAAVFTTSGTDPKSSTEIGTAASTIVKVTNDYVWDTTASFETALRTQINGGATSKFDDAVNAAAVAARAFFSDVTVTGTVGNNGNRGVNITKDFVAGALDPATLSLNISGVTLTEKQKDLIRDGVVTELRMPLSVTGTVGSSAKPLNLNSVSAFQFTGKSRTSYQQVFDTWVGDTGELNRVKSGGQFPNNIPPLTDTQYSAMYTVPLTLSKNAGDPQQGPCDFP